MNNESIFFIFNVLFRKRKKEKVRNSLTTQWRWPVKLILNDTDNIILSSAQFNLKQECQITFANKSNSNKEACYCLFEWINSCSKLNKEAQAFFIKITTKGQLNKIKLVLVLSNLDVWSL